MFNKVNKILLVALGPKHDVGKMIQPAFQSTVSSVLDVRTGIDSNLLFGE